MRQNLPALNDAGWPGAAALYGGKVFGGDAVLAQRRSKPGRGGHGVLHGQVDADSTGR
jgi:hypothetical protein